MFMHIETLLQTVGLLPFISLTCPLISNYVRIFYLNLTHHLVNDDLLLESTVRSHPIAINEHALSSLGAPSCRPRIYDMWAIPIYDTFSYVEAQKFITENPSLNSEIKLSTPMLTTPARILHFIISYNLLSRVGHHDEVTYMDAYMIFHILKGIPFNFAHIILAHMIDALSHRPKSLPFGTVLCHIFSSRGILLHLQRSSPTHLSVSLPLHLGRWSTK